VEEIPFNGAKGNIRHYTVSHQEKNLDAEKIGSIVNHSFTREVPGLHLGMDTVLLPPCLRYFVVILFVGNLELVHDPFQSHLFHIVTNLSCHHSTVSILRW
jgi:hypothetical protein